MVHLLPPSQFLPTLPRGQPPTLSPLLSDRLDQCIESLRVLLLPSLVGIDGSIVGQEAPVQSRRDGAAEGEEKTETARTESAAEEEEEDEVVMDEFERQWAENWLNQVIQRGEAWIAELEEEDDEEVEEVCENVDARRSHAAGSSPGDNVTAKAPFTPAAEETTGPDTSLGFNSNVECTGAHTIPGNSLETSTQIELAKRHHVIQSAAALLSLLSGCSASGAIHRTLAFPLNSEFILTATDLVSSSHMVDHPMVQLNPLDSSVRDLVIQINDAPLADHLSVGVQTWGSSVLLGREMAADPGKFGLDLREYAEARCVGNGEGDCDGGPRILELGAGTGVLSIICRGLLDISARNYVGEEISGPAQQRRGTLVATDYHPLVLSNLQACVDLNFPSTSLADPPTRTCPAITVMPLDWSTFPEEAERALGEADERELVERLDLIGKIKEVGARKGLWSLPNTPSPTASPSESPVAPTHSASTPLSSLPVPLDKPFDMLLACDCVYDLTHASLLRETASWLLRLPDSTVAGDRGGVLHLLSPVRRTYSEETTSIAKAFPMAEVVPARRGRSKRGNEARLASRSQTPSSGSGVSTPRSTASTAHSASAVDLAALRSGMATPMELTEEDREVFSKGMGLGRAGGWRLCTTERKELERLSGNGRSDELVYMWWTIMWC